MYYIRYIYIYIYIWRQDMNCVWRYCWKMSLPPVGTNLCKECVSASTLAPKNTWGMNYPGLEQPYLHTGPTPARFRILCRCPGGCKMERFSRYVLVLPYKAPVGTKLVRQFGQSGPFQWVPIGLAMCCPIPICLGVSRSCVEFCARAPVVWHNKWPVLIC